MSTEPGFANGNLNIAADVGNAIVKITAHTAPKPKMFDMPHARAETDEATYMRLAENAVPEARHEFVKWNGRYFVTGESARAVGHVDMIQGRNKYHRDYYGILFCSALLALLRDSVPEHINVFAGFPPSDYSQRGRLQKALLGTWTLDNLGRKIRFSVDYVSVFDEIVGGAMNVILAMDGRPYNAHQLTSDGPTIAFDLGGGTLDMLRLGRNGAPDYTRIASRPIGINDAIQSFKSTFERRHADLLRDATGGLPITRIYECFADPLHRVRVMGNQYVDCKGIYEQSINRVLNAARDAYAEMSGGSINYNYALLTGGGSALLLNELKETIFAPFQKASALFTADKPDEMHRANVRGARKMLVPLMERARQRS